MMPERPLSEEIDEVMHRPGAKLNSVHVFARVCNLEAENARLRKVYEAALAWHNAWYASLEEPEEKPFEVADNLIAAVREARDEA